MKLLLITGSTRAGSTNTAALNTVAEVSDADIVFWERLDLPAFSPDDEDPPAVLSLRKHIAWADAVLFCTPEYAGTLPGSFKNLLDWTVGGGELYGKPVAWINVAAEGRGGGASATLATVLGYLGTKIVEAACVHLPVARDAIQDGVVTDREFRAGLADAVKVLGEESGKTGSAS